MRLRRKLKEKFKRGDILGKQKEEKTKTERSNIVLDPFPATTDYQNADKPKDKKRKG